MKYPVFSSNRSFRVFGKGVRGTALKTLKILRKRNVVLDIFLVSDREMRRLNREFRGKDKATGVLSFREPRNFPHPELKSRYLGEIYLNPTYNLQPTTNNSCRLLVHGLLHLLGYDHIKKGDRMRMERFEQKLLKKFLSPNF